MISHIDGYSDVDIHWVKLHTLDGCNHGKLCVFICEHCAVCDDILMMGVLVLVLSLDDRVQQIRLILSADNISFSNMC